MGPHRSWAILLCVIVFAGCATGQTSVHRELAASPQRVLPRKVLLLPVEIRVHEVSAGGIAEKVDAWSATASSNAVRYVTHLAVGRGAFELVEPPALSPEHKAQLDQHIALYEAVAGSAYLARASSVGVWRERASNFDYTLGPGLEPLAEHTGIDAAMIVIGSDYISTAGRKAAMVMGVLVGALAGVAFVPQGGISFVSVGVVDMRTGNLLWFGTDQSSATDFRNERDLHDMLDRMFQTYPGLAPQDAQAG
jgi:hypothetical protein